MVSPILLTAEVAREMTVAEWDRSFRSEDQEVQVNTLYFEGVSLDQLSDEDFERCKIYLTAETSLKFINRWKAADAVGKEQRRRVNVREGTIEEAAGW